MVKKVGGGKKWSAVARCEYLVNTFDAKSVCIGPD